jgi:hypothetical protein
MAMLAAQTALMAGGLMGPGGLSAMVHDASWGVQAQCGIRTYVRLNVVNHKRRRRRMEARKQAKRWL